MDNHTYRRVEKHDDDGNYVATRMECNCGKRSRWSVTVDKVFAAVERHCEDVALGRN